jgi:hypothetical protein
MNDRHASNSPANVRLVADDERLLDALVEHGFDRTALEPMPDADRVRVQAISGVLGLMHDYPVDDCDDMLVHATLARIDRHEDSRTDRMNFQNQQEQAKSILSRRRIKLPDFITVAAVILIGVGVLWPIVTGVKQKSLDLACENNLRQLAYGFKQYAADHDGAVPMAVAGLGSGWGRAANTVNLNPMIEGNYCEQHHLNCPGHRDEFGPSYSYRWQLPQAPAQWDGPRVIILLGDGNPVSAAARAGRIMPPLTMSLNHGGRGQNVLSSDGATLWLTEPIIGRTDNIWLPDGLTELHEGDVPVDPWDTFLD